MSADGIDCLLRTAAADKHLVKQELELRRHRGIDQRPVRLLQDAEQRQAPFGRHDVLAARHQQFLPLEALNDFGARRRCSDALRLLQPFAVFGVLDEAPGVRHRLDQRALAVPRRRLGLLRLHRRLTQAGHLPVAERRQHLAVIRVVTVAAFLLRVPAEHRTPANLEGLPAGCAECVSADIQQSRGLAVTEVGHEGGQIRARDHHEQPPLVLRKAWPNRAQALDGVHVRDDRVVRHAFQALVPEVSLLPAPHDGLWRHRQ